MAKPSFQIDDEADEFVESRLVYGQSKSAWYRYSVKTMMQVEPILDELYESHEYQKRQEFVEAAVKEKVDEVMAEGGDMSHDNITGSKGSR